MERGKTLQSRINAAYKSFSRSQRRLANYLTDFADRASFMTARELGAASGTSESTVIRFAMRLGYKGYPAMQKALQDQVSLELAASRERTVPQRLNKKHILSTVINADITRLQETLASTDPAAFDLAVKKLLSAKTVYVIGLHSCAPLAEYLCYYLRQMLSVVVCVGQNPGGELYEEMLSLGERDVVFGISFPRYSMRTLKAMEFAASRRAAVISLTDDIHSPMNLYASCNLIASTKMLPVVESLTAPMSVLNALISALARERQEVLSKRLSLLETLWEDYGVTGSDALSAVDDAIHMRYPGRQEDRV